MVKYADVVGIEDAPREWEVITETLGDILSRVNSSVTAVNPFRKACFTVTQSMATDVLISAESLAFLGHDEGGDMRAASFNTPDHCFTP